MNIAAHTPMGLAHDDLWLAIGAYATTILAVAGVWAMFTRRITRLVDDQVTRTAGDKIAAALAPVKAQVEANGQDLTVIREHVAGLAATLDGVSARLAELRQQFIDYIEDGGRWRRR